MPIFTFANNINTTLAGAVSTSATTITLASTANLPASIPAGEVLVITLNDSATRQNFEIVYATARTGATLTVERAQEGTAALAWLTGDYAFSPPTAGQQDSFGQLGAPNTWTGANTFSEAVTAPSVSTKSIEAGASPLFLESDDYVAAVKSTNTAYVQFYCADATNPVAAVNLETGDARYIKHGAAGLANIASHIGWLPSGASSDLLTATFIAPCAGTVVVKSIATLANSQTLSVQNVASINGANGPSDNLVGPSTVLQAAGVTAGESVTVSGTLTVTTGTTLGISHWLEWYLIPA